MINNVKQIAIQAGTMMLEGFHNIQEKTDVANIVTNKDIEIQEYIISELKLLLPNSTFIAEENDTYEECDGDIWIIDPIDGTTNFAYDYRHSAVSIALLHDHEVILAVCYQPYATEMYTAQKGMGAYMNDSVLRVTKHPLSSGLVLCGTSPYYKHMAEQTFDHMKQIFLHGRDIRRSGSAVLDICYVASGRADAFYEELLSPWDYAAASLILQEAGGVITVINGTWGFSKPIGMIMGNVTIVEEIKALIQK